MKAINKQDRARFILENTSVSAPPHVPEILLNLADEAHELWLKTEDELEAIGLPPPFWAFAWAGGQGLARYVLDHPEKVRGKSVLDLATGSGLVAIAAAKAGARSVTANDIDPFCEAAVGLNSALNRASIAFTPSDFLSEEATVPTQHEVLLAGDVFYDQAMAVGFEKLLRSAAAAGKTVLVGDPARAYFPREKMMQLAEYEVPVTRELEDSEVKHTRVWQID